MLILRPHTRNVPGGWYVQHTCCTICGVPTDGAPDVFTVNEEITYCYVYRQPTTEAALADTIQVAVDAELECIRYRGTDARVIAELERQGGARLIDRFTPHPQNVPGTWYIVDHGAACRWYTADPDATHPIKTCPLPSALPHLIHGDASGCWLHRQPETQRERFELWQAAATQEPVCLRYRGDDAETRAWLESQNAWDLIDPE